MHPAIVARIQTLNVETSVRANIESIFPAGLDITEWMYPGSACVFPGVRRFVGRLNKKELLKFVPHESCIIDDNRFPRHLWTYIAIGAGYSGARWKDCGFSDFELAHIFSHKPDGRELENSVFKYFDPTASPYGLFTCAANVVLVPKGFAKPTDGLTAIRIAFFKRYIELYGEKSLPGYTGLKQELVPEWYESLEWNEPILPENWEEHVDLLLKYRQKRLTKLFVSIPSN